MAAINILPATQNVQVVFPQDLGKGIKRNNAEQKFEVDLTDYVGSGVSLVNGQITVTPFDAAPLEARIGALEAKEDKFVESVVPTRNGNTVTLTYNFSDGSSTSVDFADNDTITLEFDPSQINSRIDALEAALPNKAPSALAIEDGKVKLTTTDGTVLEAALPVQQAQDVNTVRFTNAWGEELTTVVAQ